MPPQAGMIARHKLISPNAAEASDKNRAVRNSGSRLLGSTSMSVPLDILRIILAGISSMHGSPGSDDQAMTIDVGPHKEPSLSLMCNTGEAAWSPYNRITTFT